MSPLSCDGNGHLLNINAAQEDNALAALGFSTGSSQQGDWPKAPGGAELGRDRGPLQTGVTLLTLPALRALARYPDAVAVMPGYSGSSPYAEYFLIENRQPVLGGTSPRAQGLIVKLSWLRQL